MRIEPINVHQFMEIVAPASRSESADAVARLVADRWTPQQLAELIYEPDPHVRKLACLVLGLVGDQRSMPALAAGLCDLHPQVHAAAETAAWSIWFRSGTRDAQPDFARGVQALNHDDPHTALRHLRNACTIDPKFAEAYNQCALALHMLERWSEATAPGRRAVRLQPWHFGAIAGLGHCYIQLGDLEQAACCYRKALAINPRMHDVTAALTGIEQCLANTAWPNSSTNSRPNNAQS